jgi:hypothetical protein
VGFIKGILFTNINSDLWNSYRKNKKKRSIKEIRTITAGISAQGKKKVIWYTCTTVQIFQYVQFDPGLSLPRGVVEKVPDLFHFA